MARTRCSVLFHHHEVPGVYRLGLEFDAFAAEPRAARFLMLHLGPSAQQVIPRPFSISDVWRDALGRPVMEILYKPLGRVTSAMTSLKVGDQVFVSGLFGNGFPLPAPGRRPVLLAGGIGNAPFAYQCRELIAAGHRGSEIVLLLAARNAGDIYIQPIVRELGVNVVEVTDDGSRGEAGRITEALVKRLPLLGSIEAYACGPEPMLRAVQGLALKHGFPCHLAVEERMACGYGVCNACVVEERCEGVPAGQGEYLKACVEGPVFEAREIYV